MLLITPAVGNQATDPPKANITNITISNITISEIPIDDNNKYPNFFTNQTHHNIRENFINIAEIGQTSPNRILKFHTEVINVESYYTPNLVNTYNLPIKTGIYREHTLKLQTLMPDLIDRIHGFNTTFNGPSLPNLLIDRLRMIENIVQKIRLKCVHYIYDQFQPSSIPDSDTLPYNYLPGIAPLRNYRKKVNIIQFPRTLVNTLFSINTTTIMRVKREVSSDPLLHTYLSTELKSIIYNSLQKLIHSCKRANIHLKPTSPPIIFTFHSQDLANAILADYMDYTPRSKQSEIMDPEACIHSMALYLTDLELKFRMLFNKPIPNNIYALTLENFHKEENVTQKHRTKRNTPMLEPTQSLEPSMESDISHAQFKDYVKQFFYNESSVKSLVKRGVWLNNLAHIFNIATEEAELKDRGRINTLTALYDQIQTSQTDIGTIIAGLRNRDLNTENQVQAIESQVLKFANQTRQQYAGIINTEQYVTKEMQTVERTLFVILTLLNIANQIDVLLQHVEYDHQAVQEILVNDKLPLHLSDFGSSKLISQPNITFTGNQITIAIKNSIQQKEYHKIYIHSIPFLSGKHLLRFKFPKTILTDYYREVIDYEAKCTSNLCPTGLRLRKLDSCLTHLLNIHLLHAEDYPDECHNYLQALHPNRPLQDAILLQNGIHLFSSYSDEAVKICDLNIQKHLINPGLNVFELEPHCSFSSTEVYIESFITNTQLSTIPNHIEKSLLDESIKQLLKYNLSVTKIDVASIPLDITRIEENQRNFEIDHLIKKFNSRPSTPFLLELDESSPYDIQITLVIYAVIALLILLIICILLPGWLRKLLSTMCCCFCSHIFCRKKPKKKRLLYLRSDLYGTRDTSFSSSQYRPTSVHLPTGSNSTTIKSQLHNHDIMNQSAPQLIPECSPLNPLHTINQYHLSKEHPLMSYQSDTILKNDPQPTKERRFSILRHKPNKNTRVSPYPNLPPRPSKSLNNSSEIHQYAVPNIKNSPPDNIINLSKNTPDYKAPIELTPYPTHPQPIITSSPKPCSTNRELLKTPNPPPIPSIPPPTCPDSPPPTVISLRSPSPDDLVFKVSYTAESE